MAACCGGGTLGGVPCTLGVVPWYMWDGGATDCCCCGGDLGWC